MCDKNRESCLGRKPTMTEINAERNARFIKLMEEEEKNQNDNQ